MNGIKRLTRNEMKRVKAGSGDHCIEDDSCNCTIMYNCFRMECYHVYLGTDLMDDCFDEVATLELNCRARCGIEAA